VIEKNDKYTKISQNKIYKKELIVIHRQMITMSYFLVFYLAEISIALVLRYGSTMSILALSLHFYSNGR
jgi:hypothetical protein